MNTLFEVFQIISKFCFLPRKEVHSQNALIYIQNSMYLKDLPKDEQRHNFQSHTDGRAGRADHNKLSRSFFRQSEKNNYLDLPNSFSRTSCKNKGELVIQRSSSKFFQHSFLSPVCFHLSFHHTFVSFLLKDSCGAILVSCKRLFGQ